VGTASHAIGVWLMLVLVAAATFAVVIGPLWREQMLRAWVRSAATDLRHARVRAGVQLLRDRAEGIADAARQADEAAGRARAAWTAAGDAADTAWWLFATADTAAQRALAAARYGGSADPTDPESVAARRRLLHRLAGDAHRRRQLSAHQLADVHAERDGWDPNRPIVELEVRLRCAIRDHFWQMYQETATAERAAWDVLETASRAKVELAGAAVDAAAEAPAPEFAANRRIRPAAGRIAAASPA